MLILTRYGRGILDERWYRHRANLIGSITAPSMIAQTDQNFRWIILIDPAIPASALDQLKQFIAPLGDRVTLDTGSRSTGATMIEYAMKHGMEVGGHLLTARIDDDDAWHREAIATVRRQAAEWLARPDRAEAVAMTFGLGFEWTMYDMIDADASARRGKQVIRPAELHHFKSEFMGDSVFVVSKPDSALTCLAAGHGQMQQFFRDRGLDVLITERDRPMWLYTRHKQVSTNIRHGNEPPLPVDIAELASTFGIDQAGVERYLATHADYEYLIEKRTEHRRGLAMKGLREVEQAIREGGSTPELEQQRAQFVDELERLASNVVGNL